ncbi:hypothetical protein DCAR_0625644 [Daucus carota subsp. sativus]|uniref:Late embryogenesis abundant protein LEA-2 subgroup domain-containing protein n=1 Tax=Daucus carota subsp. sativus TaxID=79200 RepID=A0A164WL12_DAUCS|nr:PREDICTED: NDR1/HIN1-like protein 12 [Daucus carota subsp. sativus]WOH06221.1 hypothetical protein DCAR_0625644 [Daucus carota subsp. sativus]
MGNTKECDSHSGGGARGLRGLCACLLVFCFIILLVFLITWAILQPKKPRFMIQDATIYAFKISSSPDLFTSNLQVTISSRNPNSRIGIYYDKLDIYASYRDQQITYFTAAPASYQGHKTDTVWSPFVYGTSVPVAPANADALSKDQANGAISLMIKINGRVRWRVGSFISGHYHLHVSCPAYIPFGNKNGDTTMVGSGVKYQLSQKCKVDV